MADNSTLPATGDVIRDIDKSGKKTQVVVLDLGGAGAESLATTSIPIQDGGNSITVDGTVTTKGTGFSIPVTLTVTSGAYSVADVVGGLITLANAVSANGKRSIINTITLAGVVAIPYELWFFNADIATPAADNAAFALAAADGLKFLGARPIATADYMAAQSAFNNATVPGVGLEIQAAAGTTSIYAYLKATAVTSPSTTTIYLNVAGEFID